MQMGMSLAGHGAMVLNNLKGSAGRWFLVPTQSL